MITTILIDSTIFYGVIKEAFRNNGLDFGSYPPGNKGQLNSNVLEALMSSATIKGYPIEVVAPPSLLENAIEKKRKENNSIREAHLLSQIRNDLYRELESILCSSNHLALKLHPVLEEIVFHEPTIVLSHNDKLPVDYTGIWIPETGLITPKQLLGIIIC